MSACASAPPAACYSTVLSAAVVVRAEAGPWILRFEDTRTLARPGARAPASRFPPAAPPGDAVRHPFATVPVLPPPPDLIRLLGDERKRGVRRRAPRSADRAHRSRRRRRAAPRATARRRSRGPPDGGVFSARPARRQIRSRTVGRVCSETSRPAVAGSAAEALGLLGDASAAPSIAARWHSASSTAGAPGIARPTPACRHRAGIRSPAPCGLALFALGRLRAYEPNCGRSCSTARGSPAFDGGPRPMPCKRAEDPRAAPAPAGPSLRLASVYTACVSPPRAWARSSIVLPFLALIPFLSEPDSQRRRGGHSRHLAGIGRRDGGTRPAAGLHCAIHGSRPVCCGLEAVARHW